MTWRGSDQKGHMNSKYQVAFISNVELGWTLLNKLWNKLWKCPSPGPSSWTRKWRCPVKLMSVLSMHVKTNQAPGTIADQNAQTNGCVIQS